MNEIIKSLYERKSMRVYEDRPIPEEIKQAILETAAQAPTAGCQQLYTILDITDQKYIVHENTYRSMEGTELRDMFAGRCDNRFFEDWMTAFCKRKYNSDFSKEMSRSVQKYLKQYAEEEDSDK